MTEIPTWLFVVAAAVRRADGRWLLHRRPPGKHHGGLWEFPGGKVEQGEMPGKALIRELSEELGIEVESCDLKPFTFAESDRDGSTAGLVIALYTVTKWRGEPRALDDGADIAWYGLEELPRLSKPPLDIVLARSLIHCFGEGNRV